MRPEEREEMRQRLLQLRDELAETEEISQESAHTPRLDKCAMGRLARMDAMQAREVAAETERRRQYRLKLVAAALRRLDEEDYGYCLDCGEEIDIRRLRFDPTASRCIGCAASQ